MTRTEQIRRELQKCIEHVDAVSFDVFDTLFVRPLCDPEDLFDIIGEKFGISDFKRRRQEAQAEAFRRMHDNGKHEITLDGIYACFRPSTIASASLKQAEFELELALTVPNPRMIEVFRETAERKPTVITSDMYLPRTFFEQLLQRHGLKASGLFISSDRDATKRDEGALFDIVAAELGLHPSRILHVGDNAVSDIQQARAKYFQTYHYQQDHKPTSPWKNSPSASLASALPNVYEADIPPNSFYELGFRYGGPAAVGLTAYVLEQAKADNIDLVLFVSRDGYNLREVAEAVGQERLVRSAYFKGSRVSFTLAATDDTNFHQSLEFFLAGSDGLAPFEVLNRIGVQSPADHLMIDLGLGPEVVIGPDNIDRMRDFLRAYKWEILKVCRQARHGLYRYLLSLNIEPGMRIALVDVGWNGTTQDALDSVLKKLFDVELFGYYLCLTSSPESLERQKRLTMRSLVSEKSCGRTVVKTLYDNRVVVELLFSAPHGSIIGYERTATGTIAPIEAPKQVEAAEHLRIHGQILNGILSYAMLHHETCRRMTFAPSPLETLSPLISFLEQIDVQTLTLLSAVENFDAWANTYNSPKSLSSYLPASCGRTIDTSKAGDRAREAQI